MELSISDTLDPIFAEQAKGARRKTAVPDGPTAGFPPEGSIISQMNEETPGARYAPGGFNWRSFSVVAAIHVVAVFGLLGMGAIAAPRAQHKRLAVFDVRPPAPEPMPQAQPEAPLLPVTIEPQPTAVKPMIELPSKSTLAVPVTVSQPAVAVRVEGPPAPAAPPAPPAPVVPPNFSAAQLNNPGPTYPYISRRNREQGTTLLKVLVTPEGRASKVEIQQSSGFERLDKAAAETVRKWRFVPAKQAGEPVAAWVLVPIGFSLS